MSQRSWASHLHQAPKEREKSPPGVTGWDQKGPDTTGQEDPSPTLGQPSQGKMETME